MIIPQNRITSVKSQGLFEKNTKNKTQLSKSEVGKTHFWLFSVPVSQSGNPK